MYKVLSKIHVGNICCVSVEGDISLLKNGLKLADEDGNIYKVETVGMTHYQNIEEHRIHAELVLKGNTDKIGETLLLVD